MENSNVEIRIPKSLFEEFWNSFEVVSQNPSEGIIGMPYNKIDLFSSENQDSSPKSKCLRKDLDYYCVKMVDGTLIWEGPYPSCPAGC